MCGIWARIGSSVDPSMIKKSLEKLVARGPEGTQITQVDKDVVFGFTRLAINGLTNAGMQPYSKGNVHWICNGEIYNSKALEKSLGLENTGSDCHCIGDLYLRHRDDPAAFIRALDGVFALVLYDGDLQKLIVARDPYGIRPLYMASAIAEFVFASELKALLPEYENISAFLPGHLQVYETVTNTLIQDIEYHSVPWIINPEFRSSVTASLDQAANSLRFALEEAVTKRMLTDRPVAALLSGGLDSSLIAALVQQNLNQLGQPPLKTYSIGFEGSSDVAHARLVADWIGSDHTEIIMTPDEFFNAIPEVIKAIESFDTTTVRASTGNYLIAKKIRELSECKVVFNGDGSDELFGGYLYFNRAPNNEAFHAETARLLKDLHYFDVLRSDRSISANGLEARTPFLDKQFVAVVRSIDPDLLRPIPGKRMEKYILRYAFDDGVTLPEEVLWRRKEAFSDGVSTPEKAWFQEIQDRVSKIVPANWKAKLSASPHLPPTTPEEYYYRFLFTTAYGLNAIKVATPYKWMPRWSPETTDPSARTLTVYAQAS
jgi:asparagine synthase (glutamine-hydrolysing)